MNWGHLFFSFSGRINRAKYWAASLLLVLAMVVPLMLAAATMSTAAWVLAAAVFIGVFISGLAVAAKRLHDRDKSAWWLVIFYLLPGVLQGVGETAGDLGTILVIASFAISIWALVELGILRGTAGPNRFGPDPLGAGAGDIGWPTRSVP